MSFETPSGLHISGAWTKAGLASCIHVKAKFNKEENFLFDCGVCESETFSARNVFISHGHTDHIGGVIMHARGSALSKLRKVFYVPSEAIEPLQAAREAFSILDGKPIDMDIRPLSVGQTVHITKTLIVRVFPTVHRVQSQGYAVYRLKPGRLLPEYSNVPNKDIYQLKQAGIPIFYPDEEVLEMVYTGDTTFAGLMMPETMFIFRAPVLIMELTYIDGDYEPALKYGHVHVEDIIHHANLFQNNHLVFCHISPKYGPASRVIQTLREKLPIQLQDKVLVNLTSFGHNSPLTQVLSEVSLEEKRRCVGWGWGSSTQDSSTSSSVGSDESNRRSRSSFENPRRHSFGAPTLRGVPTNRRLAATSSGLAAATFLGAAAVSNEAFATSHEPATSTSSK